ncbi:unnamed protein product [Caenorhabditis brenneri]
MLAVFGWVSLIFVHLLSVDCRCMGQGSHINHGLMEVSPPVIGTKSEEFIDEPTVETGGNDATEETGDELFLRWRPKTIDLAPSESDYESEVKTSEEDF